MFDREKAIKQWRKKLMKNASMEDGYIEEMESHLRDVIEDKIKLGMIDEQAFIASIKEMGYADPIGREYHKTDTRQPRFMPELFWNYVKVAMRRIKREKGYTSVNTAGLAIGMACTILIFLWVQHQRSFDRFHENRDKICRVYYTNEAFEGSAIYLPGPLTDYLKNNYPEIIGATNYKHWKRKVAVGDKSYLSTGSYVDPSFFAMFTFPFIKGNPQTALDNPNSIVITEDLAAKFFGDDDPLGKTISYYVFSQKIDLEVTGVIQNVPQNSHLQFDFLIPYEIGYDWMKTWNNNSGWIYVMLNPNSSYRELGEKISGVLQIHRPESADVLHLQPLEKIHLFAPRGVGQIVYVYIFSIMALIVLMIACVNFMNLSTARSEKRCKEIGIKKIVGSSRAQLIRQFLTESIVMAFMALMIALLLVQVVLPSINAMLGTQLELNLTVKFILALMAIVLFTGIIAGSYPAFYLSAIRPVAIIKGQVSFRSIFKSTAKGKTSDSIKGASLRKILVVTQFTLSIFFVICVVVIHQQLDYIRNRDLGFDKDHIVVVESMGELKQRNQIVKNELLQFPEIQGVTYGAYSPFDWESAASTIAMSWTGKTTELEFGIGENYVDYDYASTLGLEMVQGRFLSDDFPTDASEGCIINEAAVKAMDMENPIGKKIIWHPGTQRESSRTIVGVVRDFNTQSLHREIKPFVLMPIEPMSQGMSNYLYIKLGSETISKSISLIGAKIRELVPNDPFVHYFLDEEMNKLYSVEQLTGNLTRYVSFLAIFISCLGLLALASFSVERRTKEIGIRKVLGSSVSQIIFMLIKDFTKWVMLANIFAWPLAYFVLTKWLANFAFRIGIQWWIFLLAGTTALFIAMVVVSYQTIRAATANPVKALRYE
ncbi:MAG: ABC transporter permease [Candidatus Aminicenantes bacterium]|nr:MAG: ABC transporter permease [Candidatus Aminicenantes bacterium]